MADHITALPGAASAPVKNHRRQRHVLGVPYLPEVRMRNELKKRRDERERAANAPVVAKAAPPVADESPVNMKHELGKLAASLDVALRMTTNAIVSAERIRRELVRLENEGS